MDVFGDRCRAARGNLPSIKRAGSTTLHRNRLKTSFHSATYGPKALRSIYRDLSVLVHYQYSRDSVRYTVPILAVRVHGTQPATCRRYTTLSMPVSAILLALARNGRASWDVRVIGKQVAQICST